MARVLVLGAGMLGRVVARVLQTSNAVQLTTRLELEAEEGPAGLRRLGSFDYAVNCVGVTRPRIDATDSRSVERAIRANALFPHDLAARAREVGARVLHVSTDGVFPGSAESCDEGTPPAPDETYGWTKALGEVRTPEVLVLRCSIVGPDPVGRRGLLEWLRGQPERAAVTGFTAQTWNGVTTLQLAELFRRVIESGRFEELRAESWVHHFCPNRATTKHDLLVALRDAYRPDLTVDAAPGQPVRRLLATSFRILRELFGENIQLADAVRELRQTCD